MLSVVVITMNERCNIARCLASVDWSDDIIIVDSGSTDGTVELAKSLGARVIHRPFDNFANQRNYALEQCALENEWVLHIDADEEVDEQLHEELMKLARTPHTGLDAYAIPFKLMLTGKWLKHAGLYPSYQVRFGRRDKLRFKMVGHGQRESLPQERVGLLRGHLIHHNFSHGVTEWFIKHSHYAKDEANHAQSISDKWRITDCLARDPLIRRRSLKSLSNRLPFRPAVRFLYMYFIRRGFLDGGAGLTYCLMVMIYQLMIDVNRYELRHQAQQSLDASETGK